MNTNVASFTDEAISVLSDEVLEGLGRDTAEVRGLPNEAFTTDAFLSLEYRTLFKRSWVFAGRASAIANPGDVEPVEIAGSSLFMVRDTDQKIRVFHNVCPHRGARLVIESMQGAPSLTCPYHAWSYELDGDLKGRPHFHGPNQHDRGNAEGENAMDRVCLFEVRSSLWHDWVFVNLDGVAQPFDDYLAPIHSHLDGWDLSQFRFARHDRFEFRCNWKLAAENFSDYYHNFKVHPDMVGAAFVAEKSGPAHPAGVHLSLLSIMSASEQMVFIEKHGRSSYPRGIVRREAFDPAGRHRVSQYRHGVVSRICGVCVFRTARSRPVHHAHVVLLCG